MDRLTAMRVFVEVVQAGSQTAAADRLDMSRAMVTRYLAELEAWLGERLLHRTTRRLSLTDAGQACLLRCQHVLAEVDELEAIADARHAEPSGPVRITCAPSIGRVFLMPAMVDFLARYPKVQVDLQFSDRGVNLVEERIDIALRITNVLDPTLIARQLGTCHSLLCASPDYLARHGMPARPEDLSRHNCLTYTYISRSEWRLSRGNQTLPVQVGGNLSGNEVSCLLDATLAGMGISMQPRYLATHALARGELIPVLPEWSVPTLCFHALYTSRRYQPAAHRSLLDFLAERMANADF